MTELAFAGRHAVVCGSTQGIGRACAEMLAHAGASITLFARNADGLEMVRAGLPGDGHGFIEVNFRDASAVGAAARRAVDERGPAHILINNTGGPPAGLAIDAEPSAFTAAFEQHLLCNQTLVQTFAPGMRDASYGRIVNIISTSVVTPIKGLGVSNTIRGAVANWARTLAAELAPFGITVNNVLPGFTDTARLRAIIKGRAERAGRSEDEIAKQMQSSVPAARFGTVEEVAAAVTFLASAGAAYINGVNLPVDGGRLAAQ